MEKKRCGWVPPNKPFYIDYHDHEWGRPVHNDRHLFEMLILEGAQAGLSWETILKRRDGYRKAFHNFEPVKVSKMTDEELVQQLENPEIIRNRLKVMSVRKNAIALLAIQKQFGTFDNYLWKFVHDKTKVSQNRGLSDLPSSTVESDALSKDLKKRGMTFVGSTIIYAFMQAVGLVNDHSKNCYLFGKTLEIYNDADLPV